MIHIPDIVTLLYFVNSMARLSGLQREVLSLYRNCLRAIRQKPPVSRSPPSQTSADLRRNQGTISRTMPGMVSFQHLQLCALRLRRPRAEFQKHITVNKKDFGAIEYLLRKGNRQLEMYASPGIRNIR